MSNISLLNSQLYRSIKSGKQYDKYFSNAECKSVFLGKGVTTFGLEKMKEWTEKHYRQANKIAKVLHKQALPDTVANIKQFLYDHLQYDADGFEQNLRSPNCSWSVKKADCKSYSLFAGCILKVLKIPFSYRKITQPFSPKNWSHVYVVVKDQKGKELIIDATIPSNNEVSYVKKEDLKMEGKLPYYGLNAAIQGSNSSNENAEIVANFKDYLATLNAQGISVATTNKILNTVRQFTDLGVDPIIEIDDNKITINNIVIPFNGLQGMGFAVATTVASGGFSKVFGSLKKLFGPEDRGSVLSRADSQAKELMEGVANTFSNRGQAAAISQLDEIASKESANLRRMKSANSKAMGKRKLELYSQFRVELQNNNFSQPQQQNFQTPQNNQSSRGGFLDRAVEVANGFLQDPQTGQIYTPEQAMQMQQQAPISQNTNGFMGKNTTTILLVGAGLLVVGGGIILMKSKK